MGNQPPSTVGEYFSYLSELGRQEPNRRESLGEYLGPLPLGYRRVRDSCGLKIVIEEDTAELIRLGFSLTAYGRESVRNILRTLTCKGLRNHRGEPLGSSTLWKMLTNPFYAGLRTVDGKTVESNHQAIVDRRTFEEAQEALFGRRRRSWAASSCP